MRRESSIFVEHSWIWPLNVASLKEGNFLNVGATPPSLGFLFCSTSPMFLLSFSSLTGPPSCTCSQEHSFTPKFTHLFTEPNLQSASASRSWGLRTQETTWILTLRSSRSMKVPMFPCQEPPQEQKHPTLDSLLIPQPQVHMLRGCWTTGHNNKGLLFILYIYIYKIYFSCHTMQHGELLQPGVESSPSTVEAWNLSHWTTREVLRVIYLKKKRTKGYLLKWI